MENLFYDRTIKKVDFYFKFFCELKENSFHFFFFLKKKKIFDLKGSIRSRYVRSTEKDDVLMDENLIEGFFFLNQKKKKKKKNE